MDKDTLMKRLPVLGVLALALVGCGKPAVIPPQPVGTAIVPSTAPATTPSGPAKLEVDVELQKAGITVTEKLRQDKKLVLLIGSTQQDFDSSNFDCLLYDGSGKMLSKTGLSIPKFAKGESFEWELLDEQLPNTTRVVIQPLGKKEAK